MNKIAENGANASGDTTASTVDYARQQDALKAALLGGRPPAPPSPMATTTPAGNKTPTKRTGRSRRGTRSQGNRPGTNGKPTAARRQGLAVHIDVKDIDAIRAESGPSGPLLGYWLALNKLAFAKGNGFRATYAILRIESKLSDRQISACNKALEKLGMLAVERQTGKRKPNVFRLLKGCYVNHSRELPTSPAAAGGDLPPPAADPPPIFTMPPPEGA